MIRKIKTVFKIVIIIIQISLSLVSVVGLLSTTRTLAQPDNLSIDMEGSTFTLSQSGSEVQIPSCFNNLGAYDITEIDYTVKITILEKPEFVDISRKRYTILDKTYPNLNFPAACETNFMFNATAGDFSYGFDTPVWIQINNEEFDIYAEFIVSGKTNLDLVDFSIYFNYTITEAVYSA